MLHSGCPNATPGALQYLAIAHVPLATPFRHTTTADDRARRSAATGRAACPAVAAAATTTAQRPLAATAEGAPHEAPSLLPLSPVERFIALALRARQFCDTAGGCVAVCPSAEYTQARSSATSPSSEFVNSDVVRAKARTREHGAVCLPLFFLITKKPVPMPVHSRTVNLSFSGAS